MRAGYSATPLATKLGIKAHDTVFTINAPGPYRDWLGELPETTLTSTESRGGADIVHLFVTSVAELKRQLPLAREAMKPDGAIWVSWYKKSAKIATDVTENTIRASALRTDLVDVKVCAATEIWSGLKLVIRKALR
jgi:hypothetical protein